MNRKIAATPKLGAKTNQIDPEDKSEIQKQKQQLEQKKI
jgi:hypothetical protein